MTDVSTSTTTVTTKGGRIVPVLMTTAAEKEKNTAQPVIAEGDDAARILNKVRNFSPGGLPSGIIGP